MKKNKTELGILSLFIFGVFFVNFSILAVVDSREIRNNRYLKTESIIMLDDEIKTKTIVLENPEEIKNHLESQGQEYDSSIFRITIFDKNIKNNEISQKLGNDYYMVNLNKRFYTDFNDVLDNSIFPGGNVQAIYSQEISNGVQAYAGVGAYTLSGLLGFNVERKSIFTKSWDKSYGNNRVEISVYPRYNRYTFELWEDDIWYDDYLGRGDVLQGMGLEIIERYLKERG